MTKTETKETHEQYIHRMTGTEGKLFTPTGWISIQNFKYRNKRMLFIQVYTGCIYKEGQPIAQFWMNPTDAVHTACQLLKESQIWNDKRTASSGKEASDD